MHWMPLHQLTCFTCYCKCPNVCMAFAKDFTKGHIHISIAGTMSETAFEKSCMQCIVMPHTRTQKMLNKNSIPKQRQQKKWQIQSESVYARRATKSDKEFSLNDSLQFFLSLLLLLILYCFANSRWYSLHFGFCECVAFTPFQFLFFVFLRMPLHHISMFAFVHRSLFWIHVFQHFYSIYFIYLFCLIANVIVAVGDGFSGRKCLWTL